mmetsp:Transcript_21119/g.59718  ORF Transcript_21119/g.59718 Transcript_21119/m.59718 type:complete len:101 (-) Transcript_21119:70-372(-)
MHLSTTWNAFAADLFACGVAAYCLAMGRYPWKSTRPGVCRRFAYYEKFGFLALLQKEGVMLGTKATSRASLYLARLLGILLHADPAVRFTFMQSLSSPGN